MPQILDLIQQARTQTGAHAHIPNGFDAPTHIQEMRAAAAGVVRLHDLLPEHTINRASPLAAIAQHDAGRQILLSSALALNSRVCQAGTRLVPVSDAAEPVSTEGAHKFTAWQRRAAHFGIIDAAEFAVVPDADPEADPPESGEVSVSDLPIALTEIALGDAATHGVRFEIPRALTKSRGDAEIEYVVMTSLALGLANLADAVVLSAIKASTPNVFSLAAAAARGVRFGELKGIIGTSGNGAAVAEDGGLRLAGVSAELSDQIDISVVGSFARSGLAVNEEIFLIVDRLNAAGSMAVTAWVNCQALLPDATGTFWTVGA